MTAVVGLDHPKPVDKPINIVITIIDNELVFRLSDSFHNGPRYQHKFPVTTVGMMQSAYSTGIHVYYYIHASYGFTLEGLTLRISEEYPIFKTTRQLGVLAVDREREHELIFLLTLSA